MSSNQREIDAQRFCLCKILLCSFDSVHEQRQMETKKEDANGLPVWKQISRRHYFVNLSMSIYSYRN